MSFYGQFLTDKYIQEYFPKDHIGTCIEIGATDGIVGSNTYYFQLKGWQTLCVEPNPYFLPKLVQNRQAVENVACGAEILSDQDFVVYVLRGNNQTAISGLKTDTRLVDSHTHLIQDKKTIKTQVVTLDSILEKHSEIKAIDFISIDTEGTELDVLKGFDLNEWCPKLLVIENNFEDPEITEYLTNFGYKHDKRIGVNDFYIQTQSNKIYLPVSLGEALDKFSILQIKQSKISDPIKIEEITKEISAIFPIIQKDLVKYDYQYRCLRWINQQLWDMSDQVRLLDHNDSQYQTLCIKLIEENDARFRIKNKINRLSDSSLKEQKSYNHRRAYIVSETANYETYYKYNALIRYLAFKFDQIVINCLSNDVKSVADMFQDDPTILIESNEISKTLNSFTIELCLDDNLYTDFYITPELVVPLINYN